MKKWLIVNDNNPNDQFEVEATDMNEAAFKALEKLGWFVSDFEDDEDDEE